MTSSFSQLIASTLLVAGALFPIVNPLGNAPIFLLLTRGLSDQGRAKLARTIAVNGLVLMVVSIFIGTHILGFFGISLPVVQVSGGLVAAATGWTLLRHSNDDDSTMDPKGPCNESNYMRHAAIDSGPRLDIRGHHGGRQSDRGCGMALATDRRIVNRGRSDRYIHLPELSFRRAHCRSAGRRGHERGHPSVVFHPGVHRRADFVERVEHAAPFRPSPVIAKLVDD